MSSHHAEIQLDALEVLEGARNYNAWITSLVLPFLGEHPVEVGSGLGYQTELLLAAGLPRVTVSEPTEDGVEALTRRFDGDPRVTCRVIDFSDPPTGDHSAAYAVNVLEHVEDDVGALRAAARLVRPGGRIVVFVPAFPVAMSRFDREIGHFRRYTRATMQAALRSAGLEPEIVRYVNAPGLLAWIVWMRLLCRRPADGLGLRAWDRVVVPLTRAVEHRFAPPFGQSVLGVAQVAA
jgi:SAM-dependent methyltransferase